MTRIRQFALFREPAKKTRSRGVFEKIPGSGIWWILYYDAAGKRHRERVGTEAAARDAYHQRKIEISGGKFVPPSRAHAVGFGELLDEALASKKTRLADRSYQTDKARAKRLREFFGTLKAAHISPQRIEETFRGLRESGLSGSTVNRFRALLSSVFAYGIRAGRVSINPVRAFKPYAEGDARIRFLGDGEEKALRKVIRQDCPEREAELDLALYTGMRRGEQFSLLWENVDLGRAILTVHGKRKPGGQRRRFVPLNDRALKAVAKLKRRADGSPWVCPDKKNETHATWTRWFERCAAKAGVSNFTWHDLRHTFASRLVMHGVDIRTVQELLGHRSIVTTMKYAHLSPGHNRAAVDKLGTAPKTATGRQRVRSKVVQIS